MKKLLTQLCFLSLLLFAATVVQAQKVSIQGTLKDANGAAVDDGPQDLTFKLYDQASNGTAKWTEMQTVEITGGIYSALLGQVTPLNPSDFGSVLYLGITVNGTELSPRTELTYAPYALSVQGIAGGGGAASFDVNGNLVVTGPGLILTNQTIDTLDTRMVRADSLNAGIILTDSLVAENGILVKGVTNMDGNADIAGNVDIAGNIDIAGNADITGNLNVGTINADVTGNLRLGENANNKIYLFPTNTETPTIDVAIGDSDTGIDYISDGAFNLMSNGNAGLSIQNEGGNSRIGINEQNPRVNLHVGTNGNRRVDVGVTNYFYHGHGGSFIEDKVSDFFNNTVAIFDGDTNTKGFIASSQSFSFSDQRIKKNIKQSNSKLDLSLLNQIKITDYEYIDQTKNNRHTTKKVIAQEVKEVYPTAVNLQYNVIPNVYENAKQVTFNDGLLTITTKNTHDFAINDEVKVLTPTKEYNSTKVVAIKDAYTFVIKAEEATDQAFVYGKYVNDYHIVDYDAIAMLNVSATQELYRLIQDLQKENTALKAENTNLKTASTNLEGRLVKIEALLIPTNKKATEAVQNHTSEQK